MVAEQQACGKLSIHNTHVEPSQASWQLSQGLQSRPAHECSTPRARMLRALQAPPHSARHPEPSPPSPPFPTSHSMRAQCQGFRDEGRRSVVKRPLRTGAACRLASCPATTVSRGLRLCIALGQEHQATPRALGQEHQGTPRIPPASARSRESQSPGPATVSAAWACRPAPLPGFGGFCAQGSAVGDVELTYSPTPRHQL